MGDVVAAPSAVELLEKEAPEVLGDLRTKFPDAASFLSTKRALDGSDSASAKLAISHAAAIAFVKGYSGPIVKKSDRLSKTIRAMMQRVRMIRQAGGYIAIVSGGVAGVVTLWQKDQPQVVTTVLPAVFAMFGGIATATADFFEVAPSGLRIAGTEEYAKLVKLRGDVELIRIQAERDSVLPLTDDQLVKMIHDLEEMTVYLARLDLA